MRGRGEKKEEGERGEGHPFRGAITHRESTYAHLALLLHQSTALHHVGFSVSEGASKIPVLRTDVKAASGSARRRVHIDARTHTPSRACEAAKSLSATGETHLRVGRRSSHKGRRRWVRAIVGQRGEDRGRRAASLPPPPRG